MYEVVLTRSTSTLGWVQVVLYWDSLHVLCNAVLFGSFKVGFFRLLIASREPKKTGNYHYR